MYPFLEFGNISIPMYGLMVIVGILVALLIGYFVVYKEEGISNFTLTRILISCVIAGVVCFIVAAFFNSLFHTIDSGEIGIYTSFSNEI